MRTYSVYKNQIQGFKDVSETVKVVEKIAASGIHFLKIEVAHLKEYENEVKNALADLSSFYTKNSNPLLKKNRAGGKALVVIMGDKGLVGGLWHNMLSLLMEKEREYRSIIVIGKKGKDYLEEEQIKAEKLFAGFSDIPKKEEVNVIANYIFEDFKIKEFSKVDILYPGFISLAEQKPMIISFLPFDFTQDKKTRVSRGMPILEPSSKKVFGQLLQKYIAVYFHKIVLESKLSEVSARTVAMEHANAKIKEFIQGIIHSFRRERHLFVTQRQLESFVAHKIL